MESFDKYRTTGYHLNQVGRVQRKVSSIIIHTAAHPSWCAEQIREYHVHDRGYRDIGYHWIVERSGIVVQGRPEWQVGAHAAGWNEGTVGVCFSGHGDTQLWTPDQSVAGVALVAELCLRYNVAVQNVYGHREINNGRKTCPGIMINMDTVRSLVADRIRLHHEESRVP